jgi:hypothetical protein
MKSKSQSTFQIKQNKLRRLKALGLTNTTITPGKPLTTQQNKIIERFSDVLNGTAKVVKVPKVAGFKNEKARTAKARELAGKYNGVARVKGDKLIVKISQKGERVSINPRKDEIINRYMVGGYGATARPAFENGKLRELGNNETYALPLARGDGLSDYLYRPTKDEILEKAFEYESEDKTKRHRDKRKHKWTVNPYRNAVNNIMIVSLDIPGEKKVRRPRTPSPKASNVIPFRPRTGRGK